MPKTMNRTEKIDELKIIDKISKLFAESMDLQHTLQETIHLVNQITKADACFLYLVDASSQDLVLSASKTPHQNEIGKIRIKSGEGITGWVAAKQKVVVIPKEASKDPRFLGALPEDQFQSFLSVPILVKNKTVGVINAQRKRAYKYPERLIELITAIGRQIGSAIETARLYDETIRRSKALEALTAVSTSLNQDPYSDEIMQMIVNMTAQMMGANICSIMLLDEKKQELRIVASQALDPEYRNKPPVRVNGSLTGRAVSTKQPLIVPDVRKEPSYQFQDIALRQGLVSLLSVPMMFKSKVLGIINSYKPEKTDFTKEEISFVQSVANQCAAAIENTRLLTEKLAAQEALASRKAVERAKGILMKTKKLSEDLAFKEIQRQSMDRRKSMKEISEAIILAHELVG